MQESLLLLIFVPLSRIRRYLTTQYRPMHYFNYSIAIQTFRIHPPLLQVNFWNESLQIKDHHLKIFRQLVNFRLYDQNFLSGKIFQFSFQCFYLSVKAEFAQNLKNQFLNWCLYWETLDRLTSYLDLEVHFSNTNSIFSAFFTSSLVASPSS